MLKFRKILHVLGALDVSKIKVHGHTQLKSTLEVTKKATFNDDVIIRGQLITVGSTVHINTENTFIRDNKIQLAYLSSTERLTTTTVSDSIINNWEIQGGINAFK